MQSMVVLAGAMVAGTGAVLAVFPEQSRNRVPAREWKRNPERAAREQRHLARAVAGALLVVGICAPSSARSCCSRGADVTRGCPRTGGHVGPWDPLTGERAPHERRNWPPIGSNR